MGKLKRDVGPSFVVFLIALPLSMGIAQASGVPPALGLITAVVGGLVVGLFGGAPLQISGPSAGLAVLILEMVHRFRTDEDPYGLGTIAVIVILAGLLQACAGFVKLGGFFRAVSPAVIRGMLTGIGIIIIAKQFHVMIDDDVQGSALHALIKIPEGIVKAFTVEGDRYHYVAASVGLATLITIVAWERFRPAKLRAVPGPLAGVLVAVVGTAIVQAATDVNIVSVQVGESFAGYISLPSASSLSLLESSAVWTSALALAFVASAETLLCATAVSRMHTGQRTNYDRELAAQGIANTLCGVLGTLPVTGVISRSTANVQAGATTRWSSVMQATWIFLFVVFLPGTLAYIPQSALAAILIYVGFKLVDVDAVRTMAAYGRPVLAIFAATAIGVVVIDLLSGIILGFVLSTARLVYSLAHLDIEREEAGNRIDLHFQGSATFVAIPRLAKALEDIPAGTELHVHVEELDFIDHACLDLLTAFEKRHQETGGRVVLEWHSLMSRYVKGGVRAADRASRVPQPPGSRSDRA